MNSAVNKQPREEIVWFPVIYGPPVELVEQYVRGL